MVPLVKLAYNPDEPREPAGSADGGQWTSGGGDAPPIPAGGTYRDNVARAKNFLDAEAGRMQNDTERSQWRSWVDNAGSVAYQPEQTAGYEQANLVRLLQTYGKEDIWRVVAILGNGAESGTIEKVLQAAARVDSTAFSMIPTGQRSWISDAAAEGDVFAVAFAKSQGWSGAEFAKYLEAAASYNSSTYRDINGFLRGGGHPLPDARGPEVIKSFDYLLSRLPDISHEQRLFRGLALGPNNPLAQMLLSGKGEFADKGFVSTSTSEAFAREWATGHTTAKDNIPFMLEFKHAGGGKNATPFFRLASESEVTFRPGSRYRIDGIKKLGGLPYGEGSTLKTAEYYHVKVTQVKP